MLGWCSDPHYPLLATVHHHSRAGTDSSCVCDLAQLYVPHSTLSTTALTALPALLVWPIFSGFTLQQWNRDPGPWSWHGTPACPGNAGQSTTDKTRAEESRADKCGVEADER